MQLEPDPETKNWIYISLQQFPAKIALLGWSFFLFFPSSLTSPSFLAYLWFKPGLCSWLGVTKWLHSLSLSVCLSLSLSTTLSVADRMVTSRNKLWPVCFDFSGCAVCTGWRTGGRTDQWAETGFTLSTHTHGMTMKTHMAWLWKHTWYDYENTHDMTMKTHTHTHILTM